MFCSHFYCIRFRFLCVLLVSNCDVVLAGLTVRPSTVNMPRVRTKSLLSE